MTKIEKETDKNRKQSGGKKSKERKRMEKKKIDEKGKGNRRQKGCNMRV